MDCPVDGECYLLSIGQKRCHVNKGRTPKSTMQGGAIESNPAHGGNDTLMVDQETLDFSFSAGSSTIGAGWLFLANTLNERSSR